MRSFVGLLLLFWGPISFAVTTENICFVDPTEPVIAFSAEFQDKQSTTHFFINGHCNFKSKKCDDVTRADLNEKFGLSNPSPRKMSVAKVDESKFIYTITGPAGEELTINAGDRKMRFKFSVKSISYTIDQTVVCK